MNSYKAVSNFEIQDFDGDVILMNTKTGFFYSIDELGSMIWNLIVENVDYSSILEKILDLYDIDPIVAKSDLDFFLGELAKHKLIKKRRKKLGSILRW